MNFEPSEDQASVLAALDQVLADFRAPPVEPVASAYSRIWPICCRIRFP